MKFKTKENIDKEKKRNYKILFARDSAVPSERLEKTSWNNDPDKLAWIEEHRANIDKIPSIWKKPVKRVKPNDDKSDNEMDILNQLL